MSAGYIACACRDCMELAIGEPGAMCAGCVGFGCDTHSECRQPYDGCDHTTSRVFMMSRSRASQCSRTARRCSRTLLLASWNDTWECGCSREHGQSCKVCEPFAVAFVAAESREVSRT